MLFWFKYNICTVRTVKVLAFVFFTFLPLTVLPDFNKVQVSLNTSRCTNTLYFIECINITCEEIQYLFGVN